MVKIEYLRINLQKSHLVYFSGESLAGTVCVKVLEQFKVNSIKLHISGKAHVRWIETRGAGNHRRTETFNANEDHLDLTIVFAAKPPDKDLYLEPGVYSYPFNINLPYNLPTSFEHEYGRVRYSMVATIDIPWAFDKYSLKTFSVISNLDLNANPAINQPIGSSVIKELCCFFCKSDPITAKFILPRGGFVPGETFSFTVIIDNKSNKDIKNMKVTLSQKTTFHTPTKSKSFHRPIITTRYHKKIPRRSIDKWEGVLLVPSICPSSNGSCHIIDIKYTLIFNFNPEGISMSTKSVIPVIIGSIPLKTENSKNIQITYEPYIFDTNTFELFEGKGEVIETDTEGFKPYYPNYKNLSISD